MRYTKDSQVDNKGQMKERLVNMYTTFLCGKYMPIQILNKKVGTGGMVQVKILGTSKVAGVKTFVKAYDIVYKGDAITQELSQAQGL